MKRLTLFFLIIAFSASSQDIFIRVNQLGYLPDDSKVAIVFSKSPINQKVKIIDILGNKAPKSLKLNRVTHGDWGVFEYYYEADFSKINTQGYYYLETSISKDKSVVFEINPNVYSGHQETLLGFMRQQRCGYNPYLDIFCHQTDGYSFYGPMSDTTFVDATGGWHDAGDQLKYLITSSYATAHMLKTYELYPEKFKDRVDALGKPGANGIPDILDEAKWGLDWMLKLQAYSGAIIHQVADDRDHKGFKMPDNDNADYGWGENSFRPAYFATGKPQGLREYQSSATGVSNLAGRMTAAFAMASRLWKYDIEFAEKCKQAALSVYELGRKNDGYQQGNSYGAPYRYNENTSNDDMEWGAAELYKLIKDKKYLDQAKEYAIKSNTVDSWMVRDTMDHYELYPFLNMGHFALHELVDGDFKKKLENYYQEGIEYTLKRAIKNPFKIGVPFIWCSNNLTTSLAGQIILYQKMTGRNDYNEHLIAQRDWLFGRNPWGTSMFSGIPENGVVPTAVHTALYALKGFEVPGGLVDGPVYTSIYNRLLGITLLKPDKFEKVQNHFVVYHDDLGDYSTNEPTMDGTAGSLLMMTHFAGE